MLHVTLFAVVVTVFAPQDAPGPTAADRKTYEAVRIKAGKDPAALVKLALWCEAHGLMAERGKHLTEAIGFEPDNAGGAGAAGADLLSREVALARRSPSKRKSDEELCEEARSVSCAARVPSRLRSRTASRTPRPPQGGHRPREAGGLVRTAGIERRGDRPFHDGRSVSTPPRCAPGSTWATSSIMDGG